MLGSAARPAEVGACSSRRRPSKGGQTLRIRSGSGRSQTVNEPTTSCPLNLSIGREEQQPLLQLVKKSSRSPQQSQAMPKEASEALLSLIAKTGRDLEITRKTRKAGEPLQYSSERFLGRGKDQLQTSRNFNPITPEVNLSHCIK